MLVIVVYDNVAQELISQKGTLAVRLDTLRFRGG